MVLTSGYVMASLSNAVVQFAADLGVDLGDVIRMHGVDPATMVRADDYVPVELHEALWAAAAKRSGREDMAVWAAASFRPGLTGVVEYMLRSSSTVGEGIETWVRHAALVSDSIHTSLESGRGGYFLRWELRRPASIGARHWAEFALGRALGMVREATGEPGGMPSSVDFLHPAPPVVATHRHLFGSGVCFDQAQQGIRFAAAWLDRPLAGADSGMRSALDGRAADLHEAMTAGTIASRCRAMLRTTLRSLGDARLDVVAERLGMAPRTLQRRLRDEGVAFRALADHVKRQEADALLASGMTNEQIARKLGFSDSAALRKARRRWKH